MQGVGWFLGGVVAILAGWIAERILGRQDSVFFNLVAGFAGSLIALVVVQALDLRLAGGFLSSLAVSTVGAILLLAVLGLVRRT